MEVFYVTVSICEDICGEEHICEMRHGTSVIRSCISDTVRKNAFSSIEDAKRQDGGGMLRARESTGITWVGLMECRVNYVG